MGVTDCNSILSAEAFLGQGGRFLIRLREIWARPKPTPPAHRLPWRAVAGAHGHAHGVARGGGSSAVAAREGDGGEGCGDGESCDGKGCGGEGGSGREGSGGCGGGGAAAAT
eukprot:3698719-Prymnesium_polylepis.1